MTQIADRRKYQSGAVDQLPNGNYRARFRAPNGKRYSKVFAVPNLTGVPKRDANRVIGDVKRAAENWLEDQRAAVRHGTWEPPARRKAGDTFGDYANDWLPRRRGRDGQPLKPKTRDHYRQLLDAHILPTLGGLRLADITADDIEDWYDSTLTGRPTARAHAYALVRTIFYSAKDDGRVTGDNPCQIKGAGQSKRASETTPASVAELAVIVDNMPERLRAMVLLAAWCALRFGELAELRRKDIRIVSDVRAVVSVERGVTRVQRAGAAGLEAVVGAPKADSRRAVEVPPHVVAVLVEHLDRHTGVSADALLFPAAGDESVHMEPSSLYHHYYRARAIAGREDLRFHDLRHTGATLAAQAGGTLPELMARLGHSTSAAAMRYQHAAAERDRHLAEALPSMAVIRPT